MPIIFRYKGFEIRFWYSLEEKRRHVHVINSDANIKIWLEPEIEVAAIKGTINKTLLNEILREVRKNEQKCKDAWNKYLGK